MTITAEQIAGAVKPLEWVDSGKSYIHAGDYRLVFNGFRWHISQSDAATGIVKHYKTPELAKAAAQADYEARILAALDLQPILDTIRAEATAAAYGAAAAKCYDLHRLRMESLGRNPAKYESAHAMDGRAVEALTPADATAWLAADRAAQFKAGQEAALKGAVKGWAVLGRDGAIIGTETLEPDALYYDLAADRGQTIRPCTIIVGEGV